MPPAIPEPPPHDEPLPHYDSRRRSPAGGEAWTDYPAWPLWPPGSGLWVMTTIGASTSQATGTPPDDIQTLPRKW